MVKFIGRLHDGKLHPLDDHDAVEMGRLKTGVDLQIEAKQPRNLQFLKKFWAFASLAFENQRFGHFKTVEDVKECLAKATGHSHEYYDPITKRIEVRADSIAFGNMAEEDFETFYKDIVEIVNKRIAPGLGSSVQAELERF